MPDKLMKLANEMADKLKIQQNQEIVKNKQLLNKVKELEDSLNEFENTKNLLTDN